MMRNTPRAFVGTVVFLLDGPVCAHITDAVHAELHALPPVSRCELDVAAGTLVVTARIPMDRIDIVDILDGLGCQVRT